MAENTEVSENAAPEPGYGSLTYELIAKFFGTFKQSGSTMGAARAGHEIRSIGRSVRADISKFHLPCDVSGIDPQHPTVQPVPYEAFQYVVIPSFQSIGTAVECRMNDVLTGDITAKKVLENAQWVTDRVIKLADKIDDTQSSN